MNKAQYFEFLIYLKNRPLAFLIIELVGRLGKVVKVPKIGYFINDPDIGKQILRDTNNFNSHDIGSVGYLITQVLGDFALVNMDGLKHTEWKTRLRQLFTPKYVEEVFEISVKSFLAQVKTDLTSGKIVDLATVSQILASKMACGMIGADLKNDEAGKQIFEAASKFTSYAGLGKKALADKEVVEAKSLADFIASFAQKSYESPQRDGSVTQRLKELGFEFEEVKGLLTVILVGGTELIAFAIPRIIALLVDSGQINLLKRQPELISQAIDEGLRLVTPSSIMLRAVANDCQVDQVKFKKDHRALIVNYNMLKSPKYFDRPRQFDITRQINPVIKHSWFGGGAHFCLGFTLAHKEIKSMLELCLSLEGELKILERKYVRNKVFPGYHSLKMKLVKSKSA